jgi:hypothetical protein
MSAGYLRQRGSEESTWDRGKRLYRFIDCEVEPLTIQRMAYWMKKTNQTEIERMTISSVKREMDQPRLTESVRNGFSTKASGKPPTPLTTA